MPRFVVRSVQRVHFVLASLAGGFSFFAISLAGMLALLLFRKHARKLPVLFARSFSWVMRTMLGWRISTEGLSIFRDAAPAILVGNHQSNLDIVVYGTIFPPGAVAIGKKELAKIPLFGWFFAGTGNILVDRQNRESAFRTIRTAAERIQKEKLSVWMFPEGHRNQKAELLPFKKGAFHLAIAAQVPVVVVVSEPIGTVLRAKRLLVRPGTIRIRVLPPIPTEGMTEKEVDELIEKVRAAMQSTRDDLAATAREPV
ncbi:MAG TPA: lysophospholipid acyltransferase family protein [Thermoanaerobaculia bacterium]|nr:lysophospholipid acyltransferase family protein [Thermoanaerobaculia bacterium]